MNGRVEGAAASLKTVGSPPPAKISASGTTVKAPPRRTTTKATRTRSRASTQTKVRGFIWPVAGAWAITSSFGVRGAEGDDFHHGMDIGCAEGQPVRAAYPGRVEFTGDAGAYGNTVLLDHGSTWQTLYGHFSEFRVAPGDWANQGDVIGLCGSTGRSTGPHLHFEIRYDGYVWDPAQYLPR